MIPALATGDVAYYDGHGPVGLIPCRITSITTSRPGDTRPTSWQSVKAVVFRDHGAWKKGEAIEGWGLHFVPRACVRGSFILPYRVIDDPASARPDSVAS